MASTPVALDDCPVTRAAIISLHTSPLLQPGSGDSGGMNVYVRELVSALSQAGIDCTTFTRADRAGLPDSIEVEPGHRVVHIQAGPYHLPKEALADVADEFRRGVLQWYADREHPHVIHGNYWLSGVVGHELKHDLGVPFVSTFHTLARVKAEGGDPEPEWRDRAEAEIINCSDAVCVSCVEERDQFLRLYGRPDGEVAIVAPGVEHAFFAPGSRAGARAALGVDPDTPRVLFVGRIQPLKGPDVAIRALAAMRHDTAHLSIVGGASGRDGDDETDRAHRLVDELGLVERVEFVPPQPHHILSTHYRAADVVIVPSRSESFGLVALEAAACGTPVVAAAVGGLQSLVDDGETGYLVHGRDPAAYAERIDRIVADPDLAGAMSAAAVARASTYTWRTAAQRLRWLYCQIIATDLVDCD
ncbi:MAG: glycosyltransferase [Actinomycetota bacterium]